MDKIKILHISDIHVGMKFLRYPDSVRNSLIDARFEVIQRAVSAADELKCDIMAITGDIFETIKVSKREVDRVTQLLKAFSGSAIWILPGNHDYYNDTLQLWQWFKASLPDHAIILNEPVMTRFEIEGLNVDIYPAPCDRKHSETNALEWLKQAPVESDSINVVLAHGAIKEISPDLNGNYFPMSLDELNGLQHDLVLIGHTHVPYPSGTSAESKVYNSKVYNAGTPEPDGLNYQHAGGGWYIEIDADKRINAKRISLGQFRFFDVKLTFNDEINETMFYGLFSGYPLEKVIARVKVDGYLAQADFERRHTVYESAKKSFHHLEIEELSLKPKFTRSDVDRLFSVGSVPYVLLTKLFDDEDENTAHLALELMHEVMNHD